MTVPRPADPPSHDSTTLPRVVVVGCDGRPGGLDALALGAWIAGGAGARLVGVAAYPLAPLSSRGLDDGPTDRAEADRALDRTRRALGAMPATLRALAGSSPGRTLHEAAEHERADLLVVGSSHHGPRGRIVLGGVTAETLRRAPCAVAVAPRGWSEGPRSLGRIGVAVDGSERDARAARLAGAMAALSDPRGVVEAIHVVDDRAREDEAHQRLAAAFKLDGEVRSVIVTGEVADQLAARSGQLDLLVLGGRPRGTPGLMLLGNVTAQVVGMARCPVLVLPPEHPRRDEKGALGRAEPVPAGHAGP